MIRKSFLKLNQIAEVLSANFLKFGVGNAKLNEKIGTFSLPAGHTCPMAELCMSKADKITGGITDGPKTLFRCFAASAEAPYTEVRKQRWHNFDLLKGKSIKAMVKIILQSLDYSLAYYRIHVSGDFFNETYFKAWMEVARQNPDIIFYGYTKRISFLVKHRHHAPANFRFVASFGGKEDKLIAEHNLVSATVVFSEAEAKAKGLPLDHDDGYAIRCNQSFALLLHGTQPKDSPAANAWKVIKANQGGYNTKRRKARESVQVA